MLEGARAYLRQLTEYRQVDIGKFDQRNSRHKAEDLFEQVNEQIGKEQKSTVDTQVEEELWVEFCPVFKNECVTGIGKAVGNENEYDASQQLRASYQLFHVIDGRYGYGCLQEDKFQRIGHDKSTQQYRYEARYEGNGFFKKDDNRDRQYGKRHQIHSRCGEHSAQQVADNRCTGNHNHDKKQASSGR